MNLGPMELLLIVAIMAMSLAALVAVVLVVVFATRRGDRPTR